MRLDPADAAALLAARHADPFSVLGMHAQPDGSLLVRAFLPGAQAVVLRDTARGHRVATLQRVHDDGLFEATVPRRKQPFDYRLDITWAGGHATPAQADPYRYGPLVGELDLHLLAEGTHQRPFEVLGAHPLTLGEGVYAVAGVRFAVWAPNARRVSVVGSFNGWDGRRHPMRHRGASGVWELFIPHLQPGDLYKFELLGPDGTVLPLKCDPYARASQRRPDNASVIAPPLPPAKALPEGRAAANRRDAPMAIYEVHLGSWRRAEDGDFLDWDALADTLPAYAADLGFTHVELLPVTEHPFDGSWGYQTLGQFAPTARFNRHGTPGDSTSAGTGAGAGEAAARADAPAGFARFVAACHARGVGVLLDWVPAHFPTDAFGLAQFDGTPLYEYADPREGFHRDWNTLIYNFARREVANFLAGSALYWVERFGIDGLRVDAVASMLYRDYSRNPGEWIPNIHGGRENLEAIALLKRVNELLGAECPGAVTIAEESTAFPGVSAPTFLGGLGFHYKWNMGWMNDTLRYMAEDPVHRRWHHDKLTFGLVYAFAENFVLPLSHDEVVHGKRSLLGRMPGDPQDPQQWQRFANLRAYYGFMWGHPGKKLLFMGQEFAQPTEWNEAVTLPWQLLDDARHRGVQRWVRDLNTLYRHHPALHRLDCEAAGFDWLVVDQAAESMLAFVRRDGAGGQVIVVCNFTPVPREGFRLGVPDGPGAWREALNSDSAHYGGSNLGNAGALLAVAPVGAHGRTQSIQLTLPPLATLFLLPA